MLNPRRNNLALYRKWLLQLVLFLFVARVMMIPIQIAIAQFQSPQPQAIFVPGGGKSRDRAAAKLAQAHPKLPIWISSSSAPEWTNDYFQEVGISLSRLHLDYCAVDTVTNFTCLVDQLKANQIQHVYLLTSDFHLPRAQVIAFFIFGSRNIAVTPISIPSEKSSEPWFSTFRDSIRSMVWILTGRSFLRFHPRGRDVDHQLPL
ncbi:protein of unknown function DUF218 [Halothece sp. PCC 7418]|uniref:YdcF family protein n=1 Tax=Halothece sp. (strain PCC 7418) TaxID=65093 RepID=UPI0002A06E5B|nr:YdcF family protein [Halothece sp. PCC 7418]AFZ44946.1 protein of unknown function DUF218 [Halothece sp. PCC 7418]